jgi:phosphate butyryltransferase
MVSTFSEIRELAKSKGPKVMVVPSAEDKTALMAAWKSVKEGIVNAILIGDVSKIKSLCEQYGIDDSAFTIYEAKSEETASKAVQLVREGKANIILKGFMQTSALLKAILDSQQGLRTGRLLSDVIFTEDPASDKPHLVGLTDGGINILPGLKEKKEIIENAVFVMHKLGNPLPKIAVMAAIEVVNEAMPATVHAAELKKMNQEGIIKDCIVDGPFALDIAVSADAAQKKGIRSEVAGNADILVVPNIEAGNLLGKAFTYYAKKPVGHVIVGAKAPILIPSRNESDEDKVNSVALGVICSE